MSIVPVRDMPKASSFANRAALGKVSIERESWQKHLQAYWAPHLYVFCFDSELEGSEY